MSSKSTLIAHESLASADIPMGPSNRKFGFFFSGFFFLLAVSPLRHHEPIRLAWILASLATLTITLFQPDWLKPANKLWLHLGLVMYHVVNPIVMSLFFFGVVTPMGLLIRLSRKDPLRLKFRPELKSYWIVRTPPGPASDSFKVQF